MSGTFPVFERELPGVNFYHFEGKSLSREHDALYSMATSLEVTPLFEFVDMGEMARGYPDLFPPDFEVPENRVWFLAEEGLCTVNALLGEVEQRRDEFPRPDNVLYDLQELKRFLEIARREGIRFSLLWDI